MAASNSSPFAWRGKASISDQIKPHKGNKNPGAPITLKGSSPHGGAYSKAVPSAPTKEQCEGADSQWGFL